MLYDAFGQKAAASPTAQPEKQQVRAMVAGQNLPKIMLDSTKKGRNVKTFKMWQLGECGLSFLFVLCLTNPSCFCDTNAVALL